VNAKDWYEEIIVAVTLGEQSIGLVSSNDAGIYVFDSGNTGGGGDASAPEPATLLIVGLGIAGLAAARRRRK
jgi:hypothetical protein